MDKRIKTLLAIAIILVVGTLVFSWVNSRGYIELNLTSTGTSKLITYTLTDGKSGKVTEIKTTSSHIKRLVAKSDYTVSAVQEDKSVVFLVRSSGMLKTTQRSGAVVQERSRTFIGNQPNTCMYYSELLYSYDCGDAFSTLKKHLPATDSTPSYTNNANDISTPIKGLVTLNNQPLIAIQPEDVNGIGGLSPKMQPLKTDLSFSADIHIEGLKGNVSYSFTDYQQGFVAYSDSLDEIKYYTNPASSPQEIKTVKPSDNKVKPRELSVAGSQIGAFYNEQPIGETTDDLEPEEQNKILKGQSEFILYNNATAKNYTFDNLYSSGVLCGNSRLCLHSNNKLDIFDLTGGKANHQFTLSDVKEAKYIDQKLIIVTSKQVMLFDDSLTGFAAYSFGGYAYCGVSDSQAGFLLCTADREGQKNALIIDLSAPNTDSIDKKLLDLKESNYLKSASVYKNYIHVLQEAGDLEYSAESGGYEYNKKRLAEATNEINQAIDKLSIDRNKYQVKFIY